MELLTLDSEFQPASLIERYASLIWTERYSTSGDFQLTSTDVERMIKNLPLESMVTIRESTVPMMVETHTIKKPLNAAPFVTIKGRSFESVLERRAAFKLSLNTDDTIGPRIPWIVPAEKTSDAAYYAIRKMIGDGDGTIDRRYEYGITQEEIDADSTIAFQLSGQSPWYSAQDSLPMIDQPVPADFVYVEPDNTQEELQIEIKPGNLYSVVLELLAANHHGLKAVRPEPGNNKIAVEIYNGADLTKRNDPNAVVFDARFDQFEEATYLLGYVGSTNWGYVSSKTGFQEVSKTLPTSEIPEPEGLNRRVLYLDIAGEENVDTPESRRTRGLIELYKNNATALFDGKISEQVAAHYNVPGGYTLGDIIRLDGEYGISENVRVSEFIRSDDNTGSKAYPTFEMVPNEDI